MLLPQSVSSVLAHIRRETDLGAVCWFVYHELEAFIRIRQENLTAEEHRSTVRATTILVTSIPQNFLNEQTLKQVFSVFPGGVRNVFVNRDCNDLLEKVKQRNKLAKLLEAAETELIITANKNAAKNRKQKQKEDLKAEARKKKAEARDAAEAEKLAKKPKSSRWARTKKSQSQPDPFEREQRKSIVSDSDGLPVRPRERPREELRSQATEQPRERKAEERGVNRDDTEHKLEQSPSGEVEEDARERERLNRNHPQQIHGGRYLAVEWVPENKRPTYRVPVLDWMPSLPLIGKKV